MGGVGKTRAAVEYAWKHSSDYKALLFLTADSPTTLNASLAALCGPSILNLPEQDKSEVPLQVAAALRWLKTNPGWFLIIDNADTPEAQRAVSALLPALHDGHVVITSRLADWPAGITPLELDVLDEASSVAFLLERTDDRRIRRDGDRATAAQIARLLDHLALALEQCAAYIRHRRCSFADYVADWESKRGTVLAWHDAGKSQYPRSLAVTYDTSVAQLSGDAHMLFLMLAWFAPEPFPIPALETIPGLVEPRLLLGELADLHLARLAPDGNFCTVHRLLQEIGRQHQPERQPAVLITALRWMDMQYAGNMFDARRWPELLPLTPHSILVAMTALDYGITVPTTWLLTQISIILETQALYHPAEILIRLALEIEEKANGPEHPNVAVGLNNLAQLLKKTNRLAEAEPLMQRALAINEKHDGPEHPEVAIRLSNLALLFQETNRLPEAQSLLVRALKIDAKNHVPDHPVVGTHINNLALLLFETNRYAEAEPLFRRALAIAEKHFGAEDPVIATSLNNLARLLKATNRLTEAESLYRRALAIVEKTYGPEHPDVALHLNNFAQLLGASDQLQEAESLFRRALAIAEKNFGADHPIVAACLNNLAELLRKTNRLAEAEPMMQRVLAVCEKSFGLQHPRVANGLNNLGSLLQAMDRLVEAEPMMRRAVVVLSQCTAAAHREHPNLQTECGNYHRLLVQSGQTDEQATAAVLSALREGGTNPKG